MLQFCVALIGVEYTGAMFRSVFMMGVLLCFIGDLINATLIAILIMGGLLVGN